MEINEIFYRDSKKRCKKYSNEKLIMKALHTLLYDVDNLQPIYQQNDGNIKALQEELSERINKE